MSVLAAGLFWFAVAQAPAKDPALEQLEEFRKFYRPSRSTHEKVEAIHVLEGIDRADVAELLLDASGDPRFPVREAALEVLSGLRSEEVRALLRKAAGDEKGTKNGRRVGAIEALGRIGDAEALPVLLKNLQHGDFEVRRSSVVALGQLRDPQAVEPIAKALADPEPALRTAALDALGSIRAPEKSLAAMLPMLEAEPWQVRAAAIQAVGRLRVKKAIQPLIDSLRREEGRLREDALAALQNTTTFEYGDEADAWQRWWDGVKDRFQVPSDEELAKRKEAIERNQAKYKTRAADFMGVPTKSRRIVFVVDTSGSMEDLIGDVKNFKLKDRGYKSFMKMDIVKDELSRTIDALEPSVRFNILTFATEVKSWKSGLVAANLVNKAGAVKYVQDLKPIGGASQGFNARAGLSGAAGMSAGKTNTYAALMTALDAGGRGLYDKHYDSQVDTIYFLSDGVPSTGEYVEKDEILAEVRRVNTLRKLVIHTIAIGETMQNALLKQLAEQNGGVFVDLGR
jgi:HEAT repeat protein